jgi:predicted NAD/FAD-dependent oxidoreductase
MTEVTIVGGGLAGMVSAYRLLQRGCTVTLFEASDRLGGKAGSAVVDGYWEDHGYHIFPKWYLNIWQLIHELGIDANFMPIEVYYQLKAGQFPDFKGLKDIGSVQTAWSVINSGIMPVPDMLLLLYAVLDLLCHRFDKANFLDETSVIGYLQSRFYTDKQAVDELREMILKASSAPGYRLSARTLQTVLNNQMKYSTPMYHITIKSLQENFIDPIRAALEQFPNCSIRYLHTLEHMATDGKRITAMTFSTPQGEITHPVDRAIVTLPHENLAALLDGPLYEADPDLFDIKYLYSAQMAAMTIYTRQPIPNLPKEHVILTKSNYGLSFIDIGQTRPEVMRRTVLNVVAADYTPLSEVPDSIVEAAILTELRRFIPLEEANIERVYLQSHLKQPLFLNDAGMWQYRPVSKRAQGLGNLYLAGDYCRSKIDLATMEGAVSTGLLAAEALRKDAGLPDPIPVQVPEKANRTLLIIAKYVLMPFIALVKLYTVLRGKAA